jgi:hypothetical protein
VGGCEAQSREGTGGGWRALRMRAARATPCPHSAAAHTQAGLCRVHCRCTPATQQGHAVTPLQRGCPQARTCACKSGLPAHQGPANATRADAATAAAPLPTPPRCSTRAPPRHTHVEAPPPVVDSDPPPPPSRTPGQLRREMPLHPPARRTRCNEPSRTDSSDDKPPPHHPHPPWRVSDGQKAHQQPRTTADHMAQWCVLTPTHQRTHTESRRIVQRDIAN